MIRMKTLRIGHDHEIEIGPPLLKPAPKLVKQPARIEMIEKEIAKLEKPDQRAVQVLAVPELGQMLLVVAELDGCAAGRAGSNASGMECPFQERNRLAGRLDPHGFRRKGRTGKFGMNPDH